MAMKFNYKQHGGRLRLHFLSGVEEVVSKSAKIPLARSKRPTMSNNISLTLFSAAILAATVLLAPSSPSVAQGRSGTTSEFSAQQQQDKDKKTTPVCTEYLIQHGRREQTG